MVFGRLRIHKSWRSILLHMSRHGRPWTMCQCLFHEDRPWSIRDIGQKLRQKYKNIVGIVMTVEYIPALRLSFRLQEAFPVHSRVLLVYGPIHMKQKLTRSLKSPVNVMLFSRFRWFYRDRFTKQWKQSAFSDFLMTNLWSRHLPSDWNDDVRNVWNPEVTH